MYICVENAYNMLLQSRNCNKKQVFFNLGSGHGLPYGIMKSGGNNMSLREEEYIDRLVDKKIEEYLEIFGAVSIEGPKWCGKTWASLNHVNSMVLLDKDELRRKPN